MIIGLGLLASFPLAWLLYPVAPGPEAMTCVFRTFTDKPCPFCGLTRAFACAVHGQWGEALAYNPLWPAFMLGLFVVGFLALFDAVTGKNLLSRIRRKTAFLDPALVFLLAAWGLYRIIP